MTDAGVNATYADEEMSEVPSVNHGKTDLRRLSAQLSQNGNASERKSRSTDSCDRSCIQPVLSSKSLVLPLPNLCTPKENCQSERSSLSSHLHNSHTLTKIPRTNSGYSISTVSTPRSAHSRANQLRERLHAIQPPCTHTKTQTLCYLCHQRRARNIPIDLSEEIREREELEEQLLCTYQKLRAENEARKEQESYWNRRQDLIKQAAYNLGVADAKRIKNQFIDATQYRTFIFSSRPSTPAKELKQNAIRSELDEQTGTRQAREKQQHEDDQLLGKLEQTRLMEEICKQKENQLREKWNKQQKYKQALDFQVKHKPEPIRKLWDHDGNPVFGMHHYDPQKTRQMLTRAKEVQQAQMDAAEQRNRQLQQSRAQQIEQEKAILKRVHHDLICDGLKRREAQEARRQYLENEWNKEIQDKQDRDALDRLIRLCPTKTTLMGQLDSHRRCAQCSRDLNNKGQSNVFTDTFAQGVPFVR
ncbi:uncharacterized protein DEA37_0015056 [Paragonimus westermani]|uniref:Coiled-coil domain-containing protein n=1 Tax=Paragonimus westermani TaxID=34504 RepID=A0A5J4NUC3_9TREM|nr:uncharacterized protein DEA37_0015056 [Paragonimus westermani]